MSRVKRGVTAHRRHKRVLNQVEGFFGGRKNRFRQALHVLWKKWIYAYEGRKLRKRDFRRLWSGIELDRKVLADMAINDAAAFKQLTELAARASAGTSRTAAPAK